VRRACLTTRPVRTHARVAPPAGFSRRQRRMLRRPTAWHARMGIGLSLGAPRAQHVPAEPTIPGPGALPARVGGIPLAPQTLNAFNARRGRSAMPTVTRVLSRASRVQPAASMRISDRQTARRVPSARIFPPVVAWPPITTMRGIAGRSRLTTHLPARLCLWRPAPTTRYRGRRSGTVSKFRTCLCSSSGRALKLQTLPSSSPITSATRAS
jgi:hypothetical protein